MDTDTVMYMILERLSWIGLVGYEVTLGGCETDGKKLRVVEDCGME